MTWDFYDEFAGSAILNIARKLILDKITHVLTY
jgi:hypothetical protein